MRVRCRGEGERLVVERERADTAARLADAIFDLDGAAEQRGGDFHAIERRRHHRIDAQYLGFHAEAEEPPHDQPECDSGAARIHAPAAVERNRSVDHAPVFLAGLVAICELRVRARVVAVGLAQGRARDQ